MDQTSQTPRPSMGGAMAGVAAMVAVAVGVVSVVVVNAGDDGGSVNAVGAGTTEAAARVELTEFAIEPDPVIVGAGGTVNVTNAGSVEHNYAVEGEDIRTPNLAGGESAELAVGDLPPGEYAVLCEIPGHADAGMRATLTITDDGAVGPAPGDGDESAGGHEGHSAMDYEAMTDSILDSMTAFPAETEGKGNQRLGPTEVLPDGTKVFGLNMQLAEWEVEPGKVVEAWTFNGMVPAPLIELEIGDRMHLRVENDLPLATDVHLHGLNIENQFDGVAPFTQDLIEPGETFTYEYTADEQAVAMYHPHMHGQMLLPNGMFGVILVGDIRLPRGETIGLEQVPADLQIAQEIPMVLNDSGVIGYSLNGKSFPATEPYVASVGDWILIHYFNEGTQIHPMHLHQYDQIVVAKDGYPLDYPYTADVVNVAPGERYSVLVNLDQAGTWVWHCHILPHVEQEDRMFGMVTAIIAE